MSFQSQCSHCNNNIASLIPQSATLRILSHLICLLFRQNFRLDTDTLLYPVESAWLGSRLFFNTLINYHTYNPNQHLIFMKWTIFWNLGWVEYYSSKSVFFCCNLFMLHHWIPHHMLYYILPKLIHNSSLLWSQDGFLLLLVPLKP